MRAIIAILAVFFIFFNTKGQTPCLTNVGSNITQEKIKELRVHHYGPSSVETSFFNPDWNAMDQERYLDVLPSDDLKKIQKKVYMASDHGKALFFREGKYNIHDLKLTNNLILIGEKTTNGSGVVFTGKRVLKNKWSAVSGKQNLYTYRYGMKNIVLSFEEAQKCVDANANGCLPPRNLFFQSNDTWVWGSQRKKTTILEKERQWKFSSTGTITLFSEIDPNKLTISIAEKERAFYHNAKDDLASTHILSNVKIHNIKFEGYTHSSFTTGNHWKITHCEFKNNYFAGIHIQQSETILMQNKMTYNGNSGISGTTINKSGEKSVFSNNELSYNNQAGFDNSWRASGIQMSGSINLELSSNYIHDNDGAGIWMWGYSQGLNIHHNVLENKNTKKQKQGIVCEMSKKVTIHNNWLQGHRNYGMRIIDARNVEVSKNTIDGDYQNGIIVQQDERFYDIDCESKLPIDFRQGAERRIGTLQEKCNWQIGNINIHHNRVKVLGVSASKALPVGLDIIPYNYNNFHDSMAPRTWEEMAYNGLSPARFYRNNGRDYQITFGNNKYEYPESDGVFYWGWGCSSDAKSGMGTSMANKELWALNTNDYDSSYNGSILTKEPMELILDNPDGAGAERTGRWSSSSYGTERDKYLCDYLHDGNAGKGNKNVMYTTDIRTGVYDVFAIWHSSQNRASNVPYDIHHSAGITTKIKDQRIHGGQWASLGTYYFNTMAKVIIRNDHTDGYVIADAIKFVPVTGARKNHNQEGIAGKNEGEFNLKSKVINNQLILKSKNSKGNYAVRIKNILGKDEWSGILKATDAKETLLNLEKLSISKGIKFIEVRDGKTGTTTATILNN